VTRRLGQMTKMHSLQPNRRVATRAGQNPTNRSCARVHTNTKRHGQHCRYLQSFDHTDSIVIGFQLHFCPGPHLMLDSRAGPSPGTQTQPKVDLVPSTSKKRYGGCQGLVEGMRVRAGRRPIFQAVRQTSYMADEPPIFSDKFHVHEALKVEVLM
jgi:hypothetical protein